MTPLRHMGVNHGRFQALVPQQQLHRANVDATFDQVGRETVAERVAMNGAVQPGRDAGRTTARCSEPSRM